MLAGIGLALRPYLFKALAIIAAALTVLAILARAKNAGRLAERVEVAAQAHRIEREMAKANAAGPKTKREVRTRLQRSTF